MSDLRNDPETLAPDPRKLPPWYFTGVIIGRRKGWASLLRERWHNVETGVVEMRACSFIDIVDEDPQKVDKTRPWWAGDIFFR